MTAKSCCLVIYKVYSGGACGDTSQKISQISEKGCFGEVVCATPKTKTRHKPKRQASVVAGRLR